MNKKIVISLTLAIVLGYQGLAGPDTSEFYKGEGMPFSIMTWQVGQWAEYKVTQTLKDKMPGEYIVRYVLVDKQMIEGKEYFTLEKAEHPGTEEQVVIHSLCRPYAFLEGKTKEELEAEFEPLEQYIRIGSDLIYKINIEETKKLAKEKWKAFFEKSGHKYKNLAPDITGMLKTPEEVAVEAGVFTAYHFISHDNKFGKKIDTDHYLSADVPLLGFVYKEVRVETKSAKLGKPKIDYVKEELIAFGLEGGEPLMFNE